MTINYRRGLLQWNDAPHQQRIDGNQETPPITYGRYRLASCRSEVRSTNPWAASPPVLTSTLIAESLTASQAADCLG